MKLLFTFATLFLLLKTGHSADCPDGFTFRDHLGCYYFGMNQAGTWEESISFCQSLGGYLVEVKSEEEGFYLLQESPKHGARDYWIGLSDRTTEGAFVWEHSRMEVTNFDLWSGQQPNGGIAENCVAMRQEFSYWWTDEDCLLQHEPICYTPFLLNPCGSGWIYSGPSLDTCYDFQYRSTMAWSSAASACTSQSNGTERVYLAEIKSDEEQRFVMDTIDNGNYPYSEGFWIGLTDEVQEGVYVWAESGEESNYYAWHSGQPDSGTRGNCVALYYGKDWYDTYCGETFAWQPLCEKANPQSSNKK